SFVADMRDFNVTPHVAQNAINRLSAIDRRTTRHCGYEISQQKRKRVEEPFGWGKTIGGLAPPLLRGGEKLDFKFTLTMAAYDLIKRATADRSRGLSDSRLPHLGMVGTLPIFAETRARQPLGYFSAAC